MEIDTVFCHTVADIELLDPEFFYVDYPFEMRVKLLLVILVGTAVLLCTCLWVLWMTAWILSPLAPRW